MPENPPLRVAVLIDGVMQPAWVARIMSDIADSCCASIVLAVINDAPVDGAGKVSAAARVARWWRNRDALPYAAYRRLDRRRYVRPDDPEAELDVSAILGSIPMLRVEPRRTLHSDYFEEPDLAAIRAHELDVAIRFGFRILRGEALSVARFGVWSYHHGDNRSYRGGPAGFWEVMHGRPTTGAILQVLSELLDGGLVLARMRASTNRVSVTANKHNYFWQAAPLITKKLAELHERGADLLNEARSEQGWDAYGQPLYVRPGAGEMIRLGLRVAGRLVSGKAGELTTREQWYLAYHFDPRGAGNVPDGTPYRFKEIVPPGDRFWADPFPVLHDGSHFVFFEEFVRGSSRAHICVAPISRGGFAAPPRTVLRQSYHLSYPFVFQWRGDWWMLPETLQQRRIEVYRAERFPDGWMMETVLMDDIAAVDSTLACINGVWWLFTAIVAEGASEATLLHAYHAPTPLGPWSPHARNPLKIDVRGGRPAGPLFQRGTDWYRPAQDGAPRYGSGILTYRIDELTPRTFRETAVARLAPSWKRGINGTHTIAAASGLTMIDVRRRYRHLGRG